MKEKYDNIDEYIKDLKAAIADTDGRCASHHYNLGLALLSKRDFVGAESEFREALRESVHMAEAMVQLGGICLQRGDLEGCLRYNEEASSCRPQVCHRREQHRFRASAAPRSRQGPGSSFQGSQMGSQIHTGPQRAWPQPIS